MFVENQSGAGPAIANTISIAMSSVDFINNTLLCDDTTLFLDWNEVSSVRKPVEKRYWGGGGQERLRMDFQFCVSNRNRLKREACSERSIFNLRTGKMCGRYLSTPLRPMELVHSNCL